MLNYTTSEENYIKTILHLQKQDGTVTTNELANELKTKPASVTDMMKKLKAKKLVNYQPYQGFRLNSEGTRVALGIIRRHRLWEYFLAEKLKCLTEVNLSSPAIVISVSDQSSEILELLEHKKIAIGTRLEIKKRFEFDNSMEIRIGRQPVFTISEQLAKNIFVQSNS